MSDTPKTWQDSDICELIANHAKAYRRECQERGVAFSYEDEAEIIFDTLDAHGLIQRTPSV